LHLGLRNAYLIATALLLLIMPLGHASVLLALFVAVALGAAAMMLRPEAAQPASVETLGGDAVRLALLRRTVPELRMRRPLSTIEAQIEWRQAAQNYRQRRDIVS
jgi:hypothetical protein